MLQTCLRRSGDKQQVCSSHRAVWEKVLCTRCTLIVPCSPPPLQPASLWTTPFFFERTELDNATDADMRRRFNHRTSTKPTFDSPRHANICPVLKSEPSEKSRPIISTNSFVRVREIFLWLRSQVLKDGYWLIFIYDVCRKLYISK